MALSEIHLILGISPVGCVFLDSIKFLFQNSRGKVDDKETVNSLHSL